MAAYRLVYDFISYDLSGLSFKAVYPSEPRYAGSFWTLLLHLFRKNLWDLGNLGFYRLYADSLPPAFHILSATQPSLLKQ